MKLSHIDVSGSKRFGSMSGMEILVPFALSLTHVFAVALLKFTQPLNR